MDIKIEKLKNSEIEITGSIAFEDLNKHREQAIKKVGAHLKIDGFREGKVPEKIIIEKIGEMAILNEMGELALQMAYPDIILGNKINPISSPQVSITKLANDNPMEFKIKLTVMPEITLPDYKNIAKKEMAKKEDSVEVTEEELKQTIEQIRKSQKHVKKDGEKVTEKDLEKDKDELPELTDELVKKIGDFKDVADFKTKLKENIKHEKEHRAKEKKRMEILNAIVKDSKIELPELLVEAELRKMLAEMNDNISRMGLQFDKYLESIKKTEDDLKKEWRPDAETRVKSQLVLSKISTEEKINPQEDEVQKNVDVIMAQYKDAKKENVDVYVRMMLTNEEVFKLLEDQK
ncbi:hypothetical protein KKC45_00865 [Patescibacteria group bacterium]|nr:hypothetical protein [Patescibacteria group bacterium]